MASEEYEIDAGGIGRAARRRARDEQMAKFKEATPEFAALIRVREAKAADEFTQVSETLNFIFKRMK